MKSVSVRKAAVLDICNSAIDLWSGQLGEGALIAVRNAVMDLPPADAVPVTWIEGEIKWLKEMDNLFANMSAGQIEVMLKRWKNGNGEEDHGTAEEAEKEV